MKTYSQFLEAIQPATTAPRPPVQRVPSSPERMAAQPYNPAPKIPGNSSQLQPQKPAKNVSQKPLNKAKPQSKAQQTKPSKNMAVIEVVQNQMKAQTLAPPKPRRTSGPTGDPGQNKKAQRRPQPTRVAPAFATTQRPAPVVPVQHSQPQNMKRTQVNKEYYPEGEEHSGIVHSITPYGSGHLIVSAFHKGHDSNFHEKVGPTYQKRLVIPKGHNIRNLVGFSNMVRQSHDDTLVPGNTEVHPNWQRKGVATGLYDKASAHAKTKIKASPMQTGDAQAFWKKYQQEGDASVNGVTPDPLRKRDLKNYSFDKWSPQGILGISPPFHR